MPRCEPSSPSRKKIDVGPPLPPYTAVEAATIQTRVDGLGGSSSPSNALPIPPTRWRERFTPFN
jgi:hypothetical protein